MPRARVWFATDGDCAARLVRSCTGRLLGPQDASLVHTALARLRADGWEVGLTTLTAAVSLTLGTGDAAAALRAAEAAEAELREKGVSTDDRLRGLAAEATVAASGLRLPATVALLRGNERRRPRSLGVAARVLLRSCRGEAEARAVWTALPDSFREEAAAAEHYALLAARASGAASARAVLRRAVDGVGLAATEDLWLSFLEAAAAAVDVDGGAAVAEAVSEALQGLRALPRGREGTLALSAGGWERLLGCCAAAAAADGGKGGGFDLVRGLWPQLVADLGQDRVPTSCYTTFVRAATEAGASVELARLAYTAALSCGSRASHMQNACLHRAMVACCMERGEVETARSVAARASGVLSLPRPK